MAGPDVSIIVTTFNRADLVRRAIDTALAQTHPCEVIVADHGSTDDTPQVAASYGDRIRYVRRDRDDGPFLCWLDGAMHAHGTFVHITHDDDWLDPTFIARCMADMNENTGIVFTDAMVESATGQSRVNTGKTIAGGRWPSRILRKRLLKTRFAISPSCALLRRKDMLDALMTNPIAPRNSYRGVGPDLMMFLLAAHRYPEFVYIDEPLAFYGAGEDSITTDASADRAKKKALIRGYREYQAFFRLAELQGTSLARRIAILLSRLGR